MPTLRPYQQEMLAYSLESVKQEINTVICAPTGTGKSVVINALVSQLVDAGNKVLIVTPSCLLVDNLQSYFAAQNILGLEGAYTGAILTGVFISVASRLQAILDWVGDKKLIVIHDEAHHCAAKNWQKIIAAIKTCHIGFSATPLRLDGLPLEGFARCKQFYDISWYIERGYLSPIREYTLESPSEIELVINDLESQYEKFTLSHPNYFSQWAKHGFENGRHKPTIIYGATIAHCEVIAEEYNKAYPGRFAVISNRDSKRRIDQMLRAYKSGEIWGLVNVQLLTEGVDCPSTEIVQLCRATSSVCLLWQMIGRALRPSEGKAIVLDHAGNLQRLGSVLLPVNWEAMFNKAEKETEKERDNTPKPCHVCNMGTIRDGICDFCSYVHKKPKRLPKQTEGNLALYADTLTNRIAAIKKLRSFRQQEVKFRGLIVPGMSDKDFGLVVRELCRFGMSEEILQDLQNLRK